jgi:hypothetical protein
VVKYKYLGTNQIAFMKRFATDQIQAMLAATLFSLLSSRLLRKNLKIKIYKTIILAVVLYGHETWSLTLREEHRLRVFGNRVLKRIFGRKKGT